MEETIVKQLKEIEANKNITILFACESGSRCWGFASPDSDYDVRFIYKHQPDWYFNIHAPKDTLEFPIDDSLDISGWELRKSLQLLHKSNAPLLEWLHSPIVYFQHDSFLTDLKLLAAQCYSPIAVYHHYQSMAMKYRDAIDGPTYKLKKLFYALRTALIANWAITQNSIPPSEFGPALALIEDKTIVKLIQELIALKGTKDESYVHPADRDLMAFLDTILELNNQHASSLSASKGDSKALNDLLYRIVTS